MSVMTLEKEFEAHAWQHKLSILKGIMIRHYQDLQDTNTECLSENIKNRTAEDLAEDEILELLLRDDSGEEFNRLYNFAWNIEKDFLP